MFKIAVPTFDFIFNTGIVNIQRYSLILSYERKISKPFSLYIDNFNVLDINGSYYKGYYTKLDWGIRYFYSMNKRINQKISGNNLNGNYIDFRLVGLNSYRYDYSYTSTGLNTPAIKTKRSDFNLIQIPDFRIDMGLQKRLNNFSFIDASLYLNFSPSRNNEYTAVIGQSGFLTTKSMRYFSLGLTFKIGLGWGWK